MMWDVIQNLVNEGTTVLLTTQYLEEADQLAKKIAVIDKGKVIAQGSADELKTHQHFPEQLLCLYQLLQFSLLIDQLLLSTGWLIKLWYLHLPNFE